MSDELPYDRDAERAVLGVVLTDGQQFGRLSALIGVDDFHLEAHRRVWGAFESQHRAGGHIDGITVTTRLRERDQLESVGGVAGIVDLKDGFGTIIGGEHYCRIVKENSIRRRAIVLAEKLSNELRMGSDSAESLAQAERLIRDLGSETKLDRRLKTGAEIITGLGGMDTFMQRVRQSGIVTRWPSLNTIVGGWKPEQLIILAARPSVGKTAAALDMAEWAAVHGEHPAVYSLEMPAADLITRMACGRARVDWSRWRHNRLRADEYSRLARAHFEISQLSVWYDDTAACTVPAIHASLRRQMAEGPITMVVVDYLQLLQPTGRHNSRNDAVTGISRDLKLAAREFKIPFIVLSQLTRGPEHDKREPGLMDLRDSGSIEQDADVVAFIHRLDQEYGDIRAVRFIVAKQRNGPIGKFSMNFMSSFARFEETTEVEEAGAA